MTLTVKMLNKSPENEIDEALQLVKKVFDEFEAPIYSQEGIESFYRFIFSDEMKRQIASGEYPLWVCCESGKPVGVMAMRSPFHVSLAFVDSSYQKKGIGRILFGELKAFALKSGAERITVNSSPVGLGFYQKLGFVPTDMELITDGIRYTPMEMKL